MAVLLMAEFGWNLSMLLPRRGAQSPPDPGPTARPTYRIPLEKFRRGNGQQYGRGTSPTNGAARKAG